jgi:hypothetical protein
LASDGQAGSQFGALVGVAGENVIVGAPGDNAKGTKSGAAYYYNFYRNNWVERQKIVPMDGDSYDRFGVSLQLEGSKLAIGAVGDDDNGSDSGSAYIFNFDGTNWTEQQKLTASDGHNFNHFGISLGLSEDRVLIGSLLVLETYSCCGDAYIFNFDGTSWFEHSKITPASGSEDGLLSVKAAIDGNYSIVSDYFSNIAYVYYFDGSSWVEHQIITASDGDEYRRFGGAVVINGTNMIIGASGDDDNGTNSGAVYVYTFDGSYWVEQQKLIASDGQTDARFGYSVDVDDNYLVVGAYSDYGNSNESGSAYVYRYNGTDWVEQQKLIAVDGVEGEYFGASVSIDKDVIAIGAFRDDDNGEDSGSVYIFR